MPMQDETEKKLEIPNAVRYLRDAHGKLEEILSVLFARLEPVRAIVPSDGKAESVKGASYICPLSEEVGAQVARVEAMIEDVQACLRELQV